MTRLTHLDENGSARMVDVGGKSPTRRVAVAEGLIVMSVEARDAMLSDNSPKGDAIAAARIAGIMAAKKTAELIPLCHPIGLDSVAMDFRQEDDGFRATAMVSIEGRTGVEMEAMTAVTVALLTLYDMGKSLDKAMRIDAVRLCSKTGGRSGDWYAPD